MFHGTERLSHEGRLEAMNTENNKEIARKYFAALDRHDVDGAVALVRDDLVNHAALQEAQGADGMRRIVGKVLKAFPDQRVTCDDVIAEGDRVVCRVTLSGTNTGPLEFVRWPMPATGKFTTHSAIHVFRIAEGKIAEHWGAMDAFALLRQLGVAPRPEVHS
jgi:steroid delta-isomerase-like uncharacterized protein